MNFSTCNEIFNLIFPEIKTLSGTDIAKNVTLRLLIPRFRIKVINYNIFCEIACLCGVKKVTKNSKRSERNSCGGSRDSCRRSPESRNGNSEVHVVRVLSRVSRNLQSPGNTGRIEAGPPLPAPFPAFWFPGNLWNRFAPLS